jgi:DNA-binding NarL/FixJ family response regulator
VLGRVVTFRSSIAAPGSRYLIKIDQASTGGGRKTRPVVATSTRLSPRQREILRLLAEGVRVRGIALRLGLAESTVRNHVRVLLRRLDSHSQLQAVARAREQHLL